MAPGKNQPAEMSADPKQYWDLKTAIVEEVFQTMQAGDQLVLWADEPGWSVEDSRSGRKEHDACPGCAFSALAAEPPAAPGAANVRR